MPLDFGLLSMTELRTRPGEILDRVADGGEAFIIERSGQRKACLVPLSVFLPDISPARIAAEIQELVGEWRRTLDHHSPRTVSLHFGSVHKLSRGLRPSYQSCSRTDIRTIVRVSTPIPSVKVCPIVGKMARFAYTA